MLKLDEVIIEISQNCNLSCIMCGFGKINNRKDKFMSYEQFNSIYEQVKDYTQVVRLNGRGESTIHPNFIKIINRVGKDNKTIRLFTNGNYINDDINKVFIDYSVQLFFSIDSTKKSQLECIRQGVHYESIMNNLKQLETLMPRTFIIFTLQEVNIKEIVPIAQLALKNNCHIIYNVVRRDEGIETFVDCVKSNKEYIVTEFEKVASIYNESNLTYHIPDQVAGITINSDIKTTNGSKSICPAINKEITILYDGTLTPCNMFNPYEYGNIFQESFLTIWNGKRKKEFETIHKSYYYCHNCACLMEDVK